MKHLTDQENKMINQMMETTQGYYYFDNPSCAIDDVNFLLKIVKRLNDKLINIENKD
jgi:hypothetical protein